MRSIGDKISSIRKSEGFTQEQFAEKIGVSKPSLVKFERGEVDKIPIGVAVKMAKVLDENFGQLFEIEGCQFASAEQEALIKVLQDSENFLEKRVKELEKRIEEKDLIIELLRNEIHRLKSDEAFNVIDNIFEYLVIDEKKFRQAKTDEIKTRFKLSRDMSIRDLRAEIGKAMENRLLLKENIVEILFLNDSFCDLIEDESASKELFVENCTVFINQFLDVSKSLVQKHIDDNIVTKWEPEKIKKRRAEIRKLLRSTQ